MLSLCYENQLSFNIEIGTSYHNKNFALGLALKERLRETQKCSIAHVPWGAFIWDIPE